MADLKIQVSPTAIADVLIVEPKIITDHRGWFSESFNARDFQKVTGKDCEFVQDNHSYSISGTLRGLHYQKTKPQGRLVRVIAGSVFDVAVDLRQSSASFGKWVGVELSAQNHQQLWIPPGFAHGFLVLSQAAEFVYKTTSFYDPLDEVCLSWCDPLIGIDWPLAPGQKPLLNAKDASGLSWEHAPKL